MLPLLGNLVLLSITVGLFVFTVTLRRRSR
jgi:hypothetical protein